MSESSRSVNRLAQALAALTQMQGKIEALQAERHESIAIVGMACRLPGGANDPEALWRLLDREGDAVDRVPARRWDADALYDADPTAIGKAYTRHGAFLSQPERFDPLPFGISPREAAQIDPQHRLLLETAWQALERSGIDAATLRDSATGVFIGIGPSDYEMLQKSGGLASLDAYTGLGSGSCFAAGRLSYVLGARGPAVSLDTACSSSLVALHLACQSLRLGECDLALVGGVNLMLTPMGHVVLSRTRALAPDGRCKAFGGQADGYGRGEGCGVLVLERHTDALAHDSNIRALVIGSAVGHDGASSGLTVPNGLAQEQVLRSALASAKIAATSVDYVEAHGTGTRLGDPIEIEALAAVYGDGRAPHLPLRIGSVKSNIAHLESAAGVAGVIKTVMALEHERIPAHLHGKPRSEQIAWESLPIEVTHLARAWPRSAEPRRAGVSAFGFSGTNAHVVLQEAPERQTPPSSDAPTAGEPIAIHHLFTLSACTDGALRTRVEELAAHLASPLGSETSAASVANTLGARRFHFDRRAAFVASGIGELTDALNNWLTSSPTRRAGPPPRVAMLFSGQGSQHPGMGRKLHRAQPVFREHMDRIAAMFEPHLPRPLLEVMWNADRTDLDDTRYTQPALFTLGMALFELWRSWGVEPSVMCGHSVGELTAACAAGVLSVEDAVTMVGERARLMSALPAGGGMLSIRAAASVVERVLASSTYQDVRIAAYNGPSEVVASGPHASLARLAEALTKAGTTSRRLRVSHAFHSSLMDPMKSQFRQVVETLSLSPPRRHMLSNLTGGSADSDLATADYWARHISAPVRFDAIIETLANHSTVLLEVGPHPVLLALASAAWPEGHAPPSSWPSLRRQRDDSQTVLRALGSLYEHGVDIQHDQLGPSPRPTLAALPTYPFERQHLWLDRKRRWLDRTPTPSEAHDRIGSDATAEFPLSGVALSLPGPTLHRVLKVGPTAQGYLADHVVHGRVVVPGAFLVAALLTMAVEAFDAARVTLTNVQFVRPLMVHDVVDLHVVFTPSAEGYHCAISTPATEGPFLVHATAELKPAAASARARAQLETITASMTDILSVNTLHEVLSSIHVDWGPRWRWLRDIRTVAGAALSRVEPVGTDAQGVVHPTRLDTGFATVFAAMLQGGDDENLTPHLPYGINTLRWYRRAHGVGRWHAELRSGDRDSEVVVADIRLLDSAGNSVLEVEGFTGKRAPKSAFLGLGDALTRAPLWQPRWDPVSLSVSEKLPSRVLVIGGDGDATELARALGERGATVRVLGWNEHALAGPLTGEDDAIVAIFAAREGHASPTQQVQRHLENALRLTKALADDKMPPAIVWLTRGATAASPDLAGAPLWGFARSVMQEHPELRLRIIDVHGTGQMARTIDAMFAPEDEPLVAWRDGWCGFRIGKVLAKPASLVVDPDRAIVIAGGLGALGRRVARWLVEERGARSLFLVGRRGVTTAAQRTLLGELRERGAKVAVSQLDIADDAAVRAWAKEHELVGNLQGVVHAAGVLDDGVVRQQDPARLATVLASKVAGAWNLHALCKDSPLSFFVLFSSTASLVGPPGQASYAAANAFVDALASHRRNAGLPAQSLSWGLWATDDEGMGAGLDEPTRRRLERLGNRPIAVDQGLTWLAQALACDAPHVAIWPFEPTASLPTPMRQMFGKKRSETHDARSQAFREELTGHTVDRAKFLRTTVADETARVLELGSPEAVPQHRALHEFGLDSLLAVELRNALAALTGTSLPATLLFDYPTVAALADHLVERLADVSAPDAADHAAPASEPTRTSSASDEPIAIIGMACRLPGGATEPEAFWELLMSEVDAIGEVPADRWDVNAFYDPDPQARGKMTTKTGGFITGAYDFDPGFFGISATEAEAMDPQHRLLLEASWEALERSGTRADQLMGSATGVFLGLMSYDYQILHGLEFERFDGYIGTGNAASIASGRISYLLGLQGPSLTLDTACSSSLVATHLAVQSLRNRESDLALCGGATLILSPGLFIEFSRLGGLAPDGRCKPFAAAADGVGWGEGCAVVVLKRLSDAQRDGDVILALVKGTAVNQDGRSQGLTAPNGPAQQAVVRSALRNAGVAPRDIDYVEMHGTGTPLGDPIEAQALGAVLGQDRSADRPVWIGSVKSNLGHTQAAAGAASMIKSVLALGHGCLPTSLHASDPNPGVPWHELPLEVVGRPIPFAQRGEQPRRVGVSSFGISGTNAHVVLQEAPPQPPQGGAEPASARGPQLVLLSAASEEGLRQHAASWHRYLSAHDHALSDIAYTSVCRRSLLPQRACIVVHTGEDLLAALDALARDEPHENVVQGRAQQGGRLAFVYAGDGTKWLAMGRELLEHDAVFAEATERAAAAIARRSNSGLPILSVLRGQEGAPSLEDPAVSQPAVFAMALGLTARWRAWGIVPDAVFGHSNGEVVAAVACGALSMDDGAHIITERSEALSKVPGAMAVAELSAQAAQAILQEVGSSLVVAASNSPRSTIMSGSVPDIEALVQRLDAEGTYCRRIKTRAQGHNPALTEVAEQFVSAVSTVTPSTGSIPMRSTVTATWIEHEAMTAEYWGRNLREPVRFQQTVSGLHEEGYRRFVEVSPHPVLTMPMRDCLPDDATTLGSMRREQPVRTELLTALAGLIVSGQSFAGSALHPERGNVVQLPAQPFARQTLAIEAGRRHALHEPDDAHPLLGPEIMLSVATGRRYWERTVELASLSYLRQHLVGQAVVLPAAAMIEAMFAAGREVGTTWPLELTDVHFERAVVLDEDTPERLQVALRQEGSGEAQLSLSSRRDDDWTRRAGARLRHLDDDVQPRVDLAAMRTLCPTLLDVTAFYERAQRIGLGYGPLFRRLASIAVGDAQAVVTLTTGDEDPRYVWHPTVLDACLQSMAALAMASDADADALSVPVAARSVKLWASPCADTEIHAHVRHHAALNHFDVLVFDDSGQALASLEGVVTRALEQSRPQNDELFTMSWPARALAQRTSDSRRIGILGPPSENATRLASALSGLGAQSWQLPSPDELRSFVARGPATLVYLDALSMPAFGVSPLENEVTAGWIGALTWAQCVAQIETRDPPRLWFVTHDAQAVHATERPDPLQAQLWGLCRTIALEHASLRASIVDVAGSLSDACFDALAQELASDDDEDQVALREHARHVARLVRGDTEASLTSTAASRPHRLRSHTSHLLEQLLAELWDVPSIAADEVLIEVAAAGLNFRDVLMAMGALPGITGVVPLGGECTGVVKSIGSEVTALEPGDRVLAIARGAFATHVVAKASHVVALPDCLDFEQGAGVPIIFATAWHALIDVARLQRGERILIHAGAGGTGLAAIQIAKRAGAEIYATAGDDGKRQWLREQGLTLVLDSRTTSFSEQLLAHTDGRGVDVVLNSLAGSAIEAGLHCLAEQGRFVELGIRDIRQGGALALTAFDKGLSFTAVNLANMLDRTPDRVHALLENVIGAFDRGELVPVATQVAPLAEAARVFGDMAAARHRGKLVFTIGAEGTPVRRQAREQTIRSEATYLVTGGLGALGLSAARWLVEAGARRLCLLGRTGVCRDTQRHAIAALEELGAKVVIAKADVADRTQLERVLTDIPSTHPLGGVLHAAGVLDDATLLKQTEDRFLNVMRPKVLGAFYLHELTKALPLDFFVLYSSASSMLGAPGQANYASANAFLDALAIRRRADGLPALSIAWGAFSDAGLAKDEAADLAHRGMDSWTPEQGNVVLARLLAKGTAQVGAFRLRPAQWLSFHPEMAGTPWLSELAKEGDAMSAAGSGGLLDELTAMAVTARHARVVTWLRDTVANILRRPADEIAPDGPLLAQGLDSLRGIELRNHLESALRQPLSATLVWAHPTIDRIATHVCSLLGAPVSSGAEHETNELAAMDATIAAEVDALSDAEVARRLAEALED